MRPKGERRVMADLWLGHLAADLASGALPAVLVFLKPVLHLSYTKTAGAVLVATVTASIAQPLFGRWADRHATTWLVPVGIAASAGGIASAPLVHDYPSLLAAVFFSGLGIGLFHPEAMKLARHASGRRGASGLSLFQTGGNLGIALGPLVAGVALAATGPTGGLFLLIPGVVITLLVLADFSSLTRVRRTGHERAARTAAADRVGPFKVLLVTAGLRSVAYYGLFTFVPLWEVAQGHSKAYGAAMLSLVLFGGAIGTLCSGPLADRYGDKVVLAGSLALTPALLVVFALSDGAIAVVAVTLAGALIVSGFGLTTFMGQEYLPSRIATASGMTVGLTMGLGGVAAVLLGVVADAVNLRDALLLTAAAPALGALVALLLPRERARHAYPAHATS
jgi:FSR family fosmidomycin resistance protein-like MFS transporter